MWRVRFSLHMARSFFLYGRKMAIIRAFPRSVIYAGDWIMGWVVKNAFRVGVCLLCAGGTFAVAGASQIDAYVSTELKHRGFVPSEVCSDAVFIRRVFLDVIGTLPAADEVRAFLADQRTDKRAKLIDRLLARPEFAEYLTLRWCDLLRVKSEFPSNLWPNAVHAYHAWIRDAFRRNMPYDQFARALLTTSGSNFRDAPVNFYRPFQERTPRKILETAVLVFMGVRLENSGWSEDELLGMDAFFAKVAYKNTAEWKEEVVYSDPQKKILNPASGLSIAPVVPGGKPHETDVYGDPRVAFADWLTAHGNPWFAKAMVNRIWFWLLGRGIIHEVDDIRPDSQPWSPELLAYLEEELITSGYDLKHVYRLILNTSTYQRSVATPANAGDEAGFSHYRIGRLNAEVLIDAICRITGSQEQYTSAIPEPFTFIPRTQRTLGLADGSIKSSFLDLFGRPGRDSSLASDRQNGVSVFQTLHLLNSSHIQQKLQTGWRLAEIRRSCPDAPARIEQLYLEILSRFPTDAEKTIAAEYMASQRADDGFLDLAWALLNTSEFILRH